MRFGPTDLFPALHHRNFRLFVAGQFISLIGFWMQNVGQSWLVYRLTHSSTYLGAVAFAQQIPILLLAVPAGGFVDRANRHKIVIVSQSLALIQASLLTILTFSGHITINRVLILSALLGTISALDLPARQSFLVQMVTKESLMNAIAMNSTMFNAARMFGPAIAGFVVAEWGEGVCFLVNAVSYAAVLIALLCMTIPARPPISNRQSLSKDLVEGIQFVRTAEPVRVMLMLLGAFGIAGFSFTVLLPVFADRVFARGASGLGWLMTATGAGALLGALFLASRKGIKGISNVISIGAFGFSTAVLLFSINTNFWISMLLLVIGGYFMMTLVASTNTAIQSMIPDALRGRVMSFFTTMLIGTAPIGQFASGAAAKFIGVQTTVFISSLICLAAAYWFRKSLPKFKTEARRLYLLQNPVE